MNEPADSDRTELAALLRSERQALLSRWRSEVKALTSPRALDAPALIDHVPGVIDAMVEALACADDREAVTPAIAAAPQHGEHRLDAGYDIEEVVAELAMLRRVVVALAEDHGIALRGRSRLIVNRTIDASIADAVGAYARAEAQARQRQHEEHLAFIAHDLRTPLGAISLAVEAIERAMAGGGDSEVVVARMARTLRRNVTQLTRLVENVLEANIRPTVDGDLQPKRRRLRLQPLIEGLVQSQEATARAGGTRLLVDIPDDLELDADPDLLGRALQNLIANAIGHASPGTVLIGAEGRAGRVYCWVRDSGSGIEPALLDRLFGSAPAAGTAEGHGLGLAIVRQFIEAHGGRVNIDSTTESDKPGTAVYLELPAEDPAEDPAAGGSGAA